MFTGIVEELGTVEAVEDQGDAVRLTIRGRRPSRRRRPRRLDRRQRLLPHRGSTRRPSDDLWTADVMQETLDKTSLRGVQPGDRVNLERAVTADDRLGGHIVQGHVDGVGRSCGRTPSEHWEVVEIAMPPSSRRYLVDKGSITVDGVSASPSSRSTSEAHDTFTVSLIPRPWPAPRSAPPARRPGQPRGRRDRQARREAARRRPRPTANEEQRP